MMVGGRRLHGARRGGKRIARGAAARKARRDAQPQGGTLIWQTVVCGVLFVALIALKLAMPGHLSALRGTLGQWLVRDADFVSAFSAVGRAASGEQEWGDSLSEAYAAVFGGETDAQEVSGALLGVTVAEQSAVDLAPQRELPALAVGEQRVLGFSYACPLAGTMTSPFGWREDPNSGAERPEGRRACARRRDRQRDGAAPPL